MIAVGDGLVANFWLNLFRFGVDMVELEVDLEELVDGLPDWVEPVERRFLVRIWDICCVVALLKKFCIFVFMFHIF